MRILGQMARLLSKYTVLIKSHPYGPLKAVFHEHNFYNTENNEQAKFW